MNSTMGWQTDKEFVIFMIWIRGSSGNIQKKNKNCLSLIEENTDGQTFEMRSFGAQEESWNSTNTNTEQMT